MKCKTYISQAIEKTEKQAKYDREAKLLLSDKQILARILKHAVEEFSENSIEEIIECIEGEPQVSEQSIFSGEAITGMDKESVIKEEGKATYDVYFYVRIPRKNRVKAIIDIEAQKDYHPGHHFVPRGIFYCTRMISSQKDREFEDDDYDNIKKVYSIWICTESPGKYANTTTAYSVEEIELHNEFKGKEIYDLLSVVIIRLSEKENTENGNELYKMLTVLFSHRLTAEEKKRKLEEEHGIKMTKELAERVTNMCNLSIGIAERAERKGWSEGMLETLFELVTEGFLNISVAASKASKTENEFQELMLAWQNEQ